MDEYQIGLIGSGVLIALVLIGVRVVYACALVGLLGLVTIIGWTGGAGNVGMIPYAKGTRITGILAADGTHDGTRIHSRAAAGSGGIPI